MKKIILIMSLFLVFIVSCGASKVFSVDVEEKGEVPNFELKDLNGKKIESKKIFSNGKKTLFIIAAEWCPHCKEEMPEVQKFYDANKDKVNVVVVYSNAQSNLGKVQSYVKDNGYTFPIYYDEEGRITNGFGLDGFPFNLKINNNKIEEKLELPVDLESLTATFAK
ncbi:TlpA family protein disulfide reductase [Leptotrichia sp. HSP-536]|uniref:TlpA family protein disulfide reductase n=1 Tax=Leptotrichia alba TaxID=3239304 RepID=A0AB39V1N0_9FUSO